ncbi:hypothetical protein BCU94_18790 [Shewanella sp. 10N.286.52.C2]|nr:hypothetical protein BCU94_18790 [Shewanella sp. 10N.286.52.C2]
MATKSLIIVHGMGKHTEASVKKEVVDALKIVFSRYETLKSKKPLNEIDVSVFDYDKYFEDYREAIENRGNSDIVTAVQSVSNKFGGLLPGAALEIAKLDQSITADNMFTTHWLDVLLYRFSLLAEPIQLDLAGKIAAEVTTKGGPNVHVLGHSLGTSVLHDTLARLYGPEPMDVKLSTVRDKLSCVHMVANVSRLLQSFRKAGASEVRPALGCCTNLIQYRHKLDPIPQIKPFTPTNNGGWVTHNIWEENYQLVEPNAVTAANVHGLGHYLLDPEVHLPLLRAVMGFRPLSAERKTAQDAFNASTMKGKAEALQQAVEALELSKQSVNNLLVTAKAFKDMVESFGETF